MARQSKFTEAQRAEIVRRAASGENMRSIGASMGCSHVHVFRIVSAARAQQGAASLVSRGRPGRPLSDQRATAEVVERAHAVVAGQPDAVAELDDYDRRRWELVARLDEAMGNCRPSDLANLAKTQNLILGALQNNAAMRRSVGDTTDGLEDIAAGVRARLRRLAEADAPAELATVDAAIAGATGTDGG